MKCFYQFLLHVNAWCTFCLSLSLSLSFSHIPILDPDTSSPAPGTCSAASAGALEFMTIYSTSNLPKLLNNARDDGWRVLGAAADVPDGASAVRGGSFGGRGGAYDDEEEEDDRIDGGDNEWDTGENIDDAADDARPEQPQRPGPRCFDLHEVNPGSPTIIVLGSEGEGEREMGSDTVFWGGGACTGSRFSSITLTDLTFSFILLAFAGRGLRTLVARSCTGFVRIPGSGGIAGGSSPGDDDDEGETTKSGVDSLNVSVTGGILLWHFLSKR